ncbi:MAG TPA: hypothetical protein V6D48_15530 [Oculatellaceae cyanobacterium]
MIADRTFSRAIAPHPKSGFYAPFFTNLHNKSRDVPPERLYDNC